MTVLLPELERELRASVRSRAARTARRRRVVGMMPALASVLLALGIGAVVLTALRHRPAAQATGAGLRPVSRPPTLNRHDAWVWGYLGEAQRANKKRDPACSANRASKARRVPVFDLGRPDAAILAAFSVLDRPQEPQDVIPGVRWRSFFGGGRGVFLRYIRRSQYRFGGGYYLIPAAHISPVAGPPTRCYTEELDEIRAELPTIPTRRRHTTLEVAAQILGWQLYQQEHPEGFCLLHLNNRGFGGGGCGATLASIEQYPGLGESQGGRKTVLHAGIVPNGIASITYRYAHSPQGGKQFTITVPVINNVVVFKVPTRYQSLRSLTLRSASGQGIRAVHLL